MVRRSDVRSLCALKASTSSVNSTAFSGEYATRRVASRGSDAETASGVSLPCEKNDLSCVTVRTAQQTSAASNTAATMTIRRVRFDELRLVIGHLLATFRSNQRNNACNTSRSGERMAVVRGTTVLTP